MCNNYRPHSSILNLLKHFSETKNLAGTRKLHAHLTKTGLLSVSPRVNAKLVYSYTACIPYRQIISDYLNSISQTDLIAFNVILSELLKDGLFSNALDTLSYMHRNDVDLDSYALCSSLIACKSSKLYQTGKLLHARVMKSGWLRSVFVGSALIDFYSKLGYIGNAETVFDEIPVKNIVCVNALLSGYCDDKLWAEGIDLIRKVVTLELNYDRFTLSAVLRACAGMCAVHFGREVHSYMVRNLFDMEKDVHFQSCLIEMYGKCGSVDKAWNVFNLKGIVKGGEGRRDVVLWTSLLGVYGRNGRYQEVIRVYEEMLLEGVRPDQVAFVTVIAACGRTGQVKLGLKYFESMTSDFGLDPGPEHYCCLVDMLCKAGEMDKAWNLVSEVRPKGHRNINISTWGALLSACLDHGKIDMGVLAAKRALELEPHNVGILVMLSNLYARSGMWDELTRLREFMKESGMNKEFGCSQLEVLSQI